MANEKRLIDANAIKAPVYSDEWRSEYYRGYIQGKKDMVADIKATEPTVDAVEVVHGKWVRRIVDWSAPYSWKVECSNCDFDICGLGDAVLFKYCPNCGARMDGDGNA